MITLHESNIKRAIKHLFLRRRQDIVVIEPRFGLGDSIVNSGLVHYLAVNNPHKVYYYVCPNPAYYHSVRWMLFTLNNVCTIRAQHGREARQLSGFWNATYLGIGVKNIQNYFGAWDQYFYRQGGVPFEMRWEMALAPAGSGSDELYDRLNPSNEDYLLVCHTHSSGVKNHLRINNPNNKKIIEVFPATNNLFDWTRLIFEADEIHTVDTAFLHLVESCLYKKPGPDLYYHLCKGPSRGFSSRLPWVEIAY